MRRVQALVIVAARAVCMAYPFQPEEPAEARLLLHCRPSATVTGKPVVARLKANLAGTEFAVRFERDSQGNTRLELRDPDGRAPHFALLESASGKSDKWVFYDERTTVVMKWQEPSAGGGAWWFGWFEAEWTDQHDAVAAHDARKIILRAPGSASPAVECWVSELLMLVLRERVVAPGGSAQEWEVIAIEERQPAEDVLATPPGFREIGAPAKR